MNADKKISGKFSLHETLFNSWLPLPAFKHRQLRLRAEKIQCFWNSWKLLRNSWELLPPVEQMLSRSSSPTAWNRSSGCSHHPGTAGHFGHHLCVVAKGPYYHRWVQSSSCHSGKGHHVQVESSLQQQQQLTAGRWWRKEKKKMPLNCVAAKRLIPLQELCKIIAFSKPGWEWMGQLTPLGVRADVVRAARGCVCLVPSFKVVFALWNSGHNSL